MLGRTVRVQAERAMSAEHTGSVLFHFWPHNDRDRAIEIFRSIVMRGLLLTTTNRGALDRFTVDDGAGNVRGIEIMQRPRVCFTDIPSHLLREHGDKYGRFGVGFARETIIAWGGCPAWYLPNHHHGANTLKDTGPVMVNGMHAALVALGNLMALAEGFPSLMRQAQGTPAEITFDFTHGKPISGKALTDWVTYGRNSVDLALSFVKEVSPPETEDFRYLYEREWRIVEGIVISGNNPCRELTAGEKSELCAMNSKWTEKPIITDINVQVRHRIERVIDSFRFFNGTSPTDTVSRSIQVVMTPDETSAAVVREFADQHSSAFKSGGPEIRLFPHQ
jgi:Putative abortive phage resistance protein AbiGi, antitoxin